MDAECTRFFHGSNPYQGAICLAGYMATDSNRMVGPGVLHRVGFHGQVGDPAGNPRWLPEDPVFGQTHGSSQLPGFTVLPVPPQVLPTGEEDLVVRIELGG